MLIENGGVVIDVPSSISIYLSVPKLSLDVKNAFVPISVIVFGINNDVILH
jgi:hypothetical protein